MVQLSHLHMNAGKTIALIIWTFVGKVMSLLFNTLSSFVIAFISRSKCLLISLLQLLSIVILKSNTIKSVPVCIVSSSICHEVLGPDAMILVFLMLSFKTAFSLSSFTLINRFFSSSLFAIRVGCHLHIWYYWYFSWQSWFQLVFLPTQHFSWCTLHRS